MTALDHRVAGERGESLADDTDCTCCELPIASCGKAYAARAGIDLRRTDQSVAAWAASTADEDIDDGHDTHGQPIDGQPHTDDFHEYDAAARFKAEKATRWAPE